MKTPEELAMEYALLVPEKPRFEDRMFVSPLEQQATDLFQKIEKLTGHTIATLLVRNARQTLRIMNALPKNPNTSLYSKEKTIF